MKGLLLFCCLGVVYLVGISATGLPQEIKDEIWSHQADVNRITEHVLRGEGKHGLYDHLAVYSDDHGPRLSGSQDLEDAIDFTIQSMNTEDFSNVHGENVTVPRWARGEQRAAITLPRFHEMDIMTLGSSVPTPPGGISADVIVVRSFEELEDRAAEVPGKIVVYNQEWVDYGQAVEYRSRGASAAAERGAKAALVRSVTPYSINSPHVGHQTYELPEGVAPIPVACVTVEDAEHMDRLHRRGKRIVVNMTLTCQNHANTTSRNVVAEITGQQYPKEYVIIGGHIDTWDVGFGPMDDGGGVVMSWEVVRILKDLNLQPKRTVRTVFWTGEEWGLIGGNVYFEEHKAHNDSISLIMESDSGTFAPLGIGFTGSGLARAMLEEIVMMLSEINTTVIGPDGSHPDIRKWLEIGVPAGNLLNDNQDYFNYHHSHGDSMTMEDPDVLDRCTIVWAAVTYVVANLDEKLPRFGDYPETSLGSQVTPEVTWIILMSVMGVSVFKRNH